MPNVDDVKSAEAAPGQRDPIRAATAGDAAATSGYSSEVPPHLLADEAKFRERLTEIHANPAQGYSA